MDQQEQLISLLITFFHFTPSLLIPGVMLKKRQRDVNPIAYPALYDYF
jgi:hypothetical protein